MTDMYESCRLVYLPTRTISTLSIKRSWLFKDPLPSAALSRHVERLIATRTHPTVKSLHLVRRLSPLSLSALGMLATFRLSRRSKKRTMPCCSSRSGTWYVEPTSCTAITCSGPTWQNMDNLLITARSSGVAQRAAICESSVLVSALAPLWSNRPQYAHHVGHKTQSAQVADSCLGRLCLLLSADDGHQADVNECKVFLADAELELTHGLDERRAFNVTHGTAELDGRAR